MMTRAITPSSPDLHNRISASEARECNYTKGYIDMFATNVRSPLLSGLV